MNNIQVLSKNNRDISFNGATIKVKRGSYEWILKHPFKTQENIFKQYIDKPFKDMYGKNIFGDEERTVKTLYNALSEKVKEYKDVKQNINVIFGWYDRLVKNPDKKFDFDLISGIYLKIINKDTQKGFHIGKPLINNNSKYKKAHEKMINFNSPFTSPQDWVKFLGEKLESMTSNR